MNKVMVIAPHHDDEVFGPGGSICLHKKRGDKVTIVYCAAGWSGIPWIADKSEASIVIQAEAAKAGKILGVDSIIELNFDDRNFQNSPNVLSSLITTIRKVSPDVVYLPHSLDGDSEHRYINVATSEAIWISGSNYLPEFGVKISPVQLILGYEVWHPIGDYNLSVDISSCMDQKLEAINAYGSQLKQKNWHEGLLGLASFRGVTSGKGKYVEVFQVIKVSDRFLRL